MPPAAGPLGVPVDPVGQGPGEGLQAVIRQWRAPYETELWEITAGMRDVPGEPPEMTAHPTPGASGPWLGATP